MKYDEIPKAVCEFIDETIKEGEQIKMSTKDKTIIECICAIDKANREAEWRKIKEDREASEIMEFEERHVFQYYLAPTFDFKQEVLRYGSGVKILSPVHLVDEIKAEIDNMGRLYTQDK